MPAMEIGSGQGSHQDDEPDWRIAFESAPGLFLLLRPDAPRFTILGASEEYLRATVRSRESIVGLGIFDAFPDNPDDPDASGVRKLQASLERVLATGANDSMAVQKYDIPRPERDGGGFEERHWSPINVPAIGRDGRLAYIIHRVEDVTAFVNAARSGEEQRERTEALEVEGERMRREVLRRSAELDSSNQKLREMNERLTELDRAKTVFFSNISHEFRTPLTLLLGPVEESLKDEALDPRHRTHLTLVHNNGLRLLRLVDNLLDFARIEGGRLEATYAPTDIARLTSELAAMFDSAVSRVGLRLSIDCKPLDDLAWVDRGLWEKIVLNLLTNAFKFTLEGEIAVRVRQLGRSFELRVTDTGEGIASEELPRIFERFHRVQGVRARIHEGAGIGLSLVQELVRLHGGTIAVESTLGAGSTFIVTIPQGREHLPEHRLEAAGLSRGGAVAGVSEEAERILSTGTDGSFSAPRPAKRRRGELVPRILLVDDSAEMRAYVGELLAPHYDVDVVEDGLAALDAMRTRAPDLILSDVMMPGLDGLGLARAVRADPKLKSIPLIFLSARAGEDASVDGLAVGADDYLMKPFSARELLARVQTHLTINRSRDLWMRELREANEELEAFNQSVAHDLRSPLGVIVGYCSILLARPDAAAGTSQRNQLERIFAAARRMEALISDLLSLARVNRVELCTERLDLSAMAASVIAHLREAEPSRDAAVEIQEGLVVDGDSGLLAIALENLLGNAWKYTSKRSDAKIQVGEIDLDGTRTVFIRDNGAGFDMAYIHKLFVPFERLHLASEFAGTGIGLTTVRRVIERHGGRIWVDATPDEGATFYFSIPGDGGTDA
ncbi:MAG: ATP-binding protein [Thermoanaerobaculia bacterium]